MQRYRLSSIVAVSVLVVGSAMMLHEGAHVLAGWSAGGRPTLWTAAEVLGDFDSLSPGGYVALGASGSLLNLVFCGLGWWWLRKRSLSSEARLAAWFLFAVNGLLVTTKMVFEGVLGWGDWMTILHPLRSTTAPRLVVAALGLIGVVSMVRHSGWALGTLIPAGEPAQRRVEGLRIVLVGALASVVLVLGGSVASPLATTRSVLLSLGAGLGPFLLLLGALRFVRKTPVAEVSTGLPASSLAANALIVGAAITTLAMWLVVGPGISLG